jgi:chromosome segregation ATPase
VEIGEILELKDEYLGLKHDIEIKNSEIMRLQDKIWDLESEMEEMEDEVRPLNARATAIGWKIGIFVHKDQLPLFDLKPFNGVKPKITGFDFSAKPK